MERQVHTMSDEYRSRQERRKAQAKHKHHRKKRGLLKKVLLSLLIAFLIAVVGGGIAVFAIIQSTPELKPELLDSPFTTSIYDKNDEPVDRVFKDQNRVKVNIDDVPEKIKQAFISIEDRRFREHFGIDIRRIGGAVLANITEGWGSEGGSTITQQVVKRSILTPEKKLTRKIKEAWLAIQLEQEYTKDQILEMYLNKIYFGNRAWGVITASEVYFGTKDLTELNLSQIALLAGIPNAPSHYDPYEHPDRAAERRNTVLDAMVETGAISVKQAEEAKAKPVKKLVVDEERDEEDTTPYGAFIDQVYNELVNEREVVSSDEFFQGGLKIYTTLDPEVQKHVHQLLKSDEIPYPDEHFEAGISLIDTQSGAVRAIGGGRDFTTVGSGTNYATDVKRSPGSTIKPIIDYGPAVEYLKWSTYHQLIDEPYNYPGTNTPVNEWDGKYWGKMTMRRALAHSRNVPAAKTLEEVGLDKARTFAENLGIHIEGEMYYSASLGSIDPGVSPLQMSGAYAAFGNQGAYHKPYTVRKVVFQNGKTIEFDHKPEVAMNDYTAYMITDVLKSVIAYGTGSSINLPGLPVAGKTGSHQIPDEIREQYNITGDGYWDRWFTGYTPQYTLSVWTGYPHVDPDGDGKDPKYIRVDGSQNLAMMIFERLMSTVSAGNVSDWEKPSSVVAATIEKSSGKLASEHTPDDDKITELFVRGTEPTETSEQYQELEVPQNLNATYDEETNEITLTWDYPKNDEGIAFEVDVSIDGASSQDLGPTEGKKMVVKHPQPGSTYAFRVTAVDAENDQKSDPAEVTVKIPEEETTDETDEDPDRDGNNGNNGPGNGPPGDGNNNPGNDPPDDGNGDSDAGNSDDENSPGNGEPEDKDQEENDDGDGPGNPTTPQMNGSTPTDVISRQWGSSYSASFTCLFLIRFCPSRHKSSNGHTSHSGDCALQ